MNNEMMRKAFNDGRLYDLSGTLVTDVNVFATLHPANCHIKIVLDTPASVTTTDVVTATTDSPYEIFKAKQATAYKDAK